MPRKHAISADVNKCYHLADGAFFIVNNKLSIVNNSLIVGRTQLIIFCTADIRLLFFLSSAEKKEKKNIVCFEEE